MNWMRRTWNRVRGRHEDGSRHEWREIPLGTHCCAAMSYCHHWRGLCYCGTARVLGYSVEEVR